MIGLSRLSIGIGSQGPSGGGAPPALILDSLSAGAAYSTRKLRTAYAGAAIRVRRSSDNVEADIGFSGNSLDTAALTAHVGANSGFVVTWYDQSGNGRDMTQATQASQMRIVNAGVIEQNTGVTRLAQSASGQGFVLPASALSGASAATFSSVGSQISGQGAPNRISNDSGSFHAPFSDNNGYVAFASTARQTFTGYGSATGNVRHIEVQSGSALSVFKNGTQVDTAKTVGFTATPTNQNIPHPTTGLYGLSEVIVFRSALTLAERTELDASQSLSFPF